MNEQAAPIKGDWYWVRRKELTGDLPGSPWFPALWDGRRWTNEDCWEDFDREVIEWRRIPRPEES